MKNILLVALLLLSTNANAALKGAPFIPEMDDRFSDVEVAQEADEAALDILNADETAAAEGVGIARKYAKAVYDVAVDGGSSIPHSLGVVLPAGAIVTKTYVYINTAFTDGGTGSVRLDCIGAGDLMAYLDMTSFSANNLLVGQTVGATAASNSMILLSATANTSFNSVTSACTITAQVRSDLGFVAQSAGKFTAIVEYFDKD